MPPTKPQRPNPYAAMIPQPQQRPDRQIAVGQPIASTGASVDRTTEAYTLITEVGAPNGQPRILYNGDRNWAQVTLILETAGPVAVSPRANFLPITSGKGILLVTNVPISITIAKTTRLYYVADAINRVKVIIEPLPWLEQITALLSK